MATRAAIHSFASKWLTIFASETIHHLPPEATPLRDDCEVAGFEMDSFAALTPGTTQLPAVSAQAETEAFLNAVTSVSALGNGIYSMWRQITYWNVDDTIDTAVNRHWFLTALAQLQRLSLPLGTLRVAEIESTALTMASPVAPSMLIGQTLTFDATGAVQLVNRFASGYSDTQTVTIEAATSRSLLKRLSTIADPETPLVMKSDCGTWTLRLTGEGGQQVITGSLTEYEALSDQIRQALPFPRLLLFDGAPDQLQRLIVEYQSEKGHKEKLVVDRHSHTLSLTNIAAAKRSRIAIVDPAIAAILSVIGDEWSLMPNQKHSQHDLQVTLRYRYAPAITTFGTLSLDDPIADWDVAATFIAQFMAQHLPAMLDSRLFSRNTPRPGDLLYAQVVFHHGARPYSYLATPDLKIGDRVVVPVSYGRNYGTIVAMNYVAPADAPYPPANTKHITKLADPLEEAEYDGE